MANLPNRYSPPQVDKGSKAYLANRRSYRVLAKPRSLLGSSLGTTYHTGPRTTNTSTLGFAQSPTHSGSTSGAAFYAHNETGNTYTHLLATLWMIALPIALYPYDRDQHPTAGADDWTVFALFFLAGASYFARSTIYHVLSKHSRVVHGFAHQLDYLGIIIVTTGCFPPGFVVYLPLRGQEDQDVLDRCT